MPGNGAGNPGFPGGNPVPPPGQIRPPGSYPPPPYGPPPGYGRNPAPRPAPGTAPVLITERRPDQLSRVSTVVQARIPDSTGSFINDLTLELKSLRVVG